MDIFLPVAHRKDYSHHEDTEDESPRQLYVLISIPDLIPCHARVPSLLPAPGNPVPHIPTLFFTTVYH